MYKYPCYYGVPCGKSGFYPTRRATLAFPCTYLSLISREIARPNGPATSDLANEKPIVDGDIIW